MGKHVGEEGAPKANVARKYRLYPSPECAATFTAWGHTRRALRNLALQQRRLTWELLRKGMSKVEQCRDLTELREEVEWVAALPAQAAQAALADVDRAYQNWWNPEHPARRPKFEKRSSQLRFNLPGQAIRVRHVNRKFSEVRVPKVGWVRFRRSRPLHAKVRNATFSYTPSGGWQVSFGIAAKDINAPANAKPGVGVDFGVACSAYASDEKTPRLMPASLSAGERRRLLGLERRRGRQMTWAKRHNGGAYSKRLRRTLTQIAQIRGRQARRRLDFTHKLTAELAKNHGFVGIEDLSKGMTRSAKGTVEKPGRNVKAKAGLNREILDNIPAERRRQLAYKAPKHGCELRVVAAANTSRRCSKCQAVDPRNRPRCAREFACVACGHQDHADHNAALNIAARAAQTAGPAGAKAHNSTGRRRPSRGMAPGASVKPGTLVSGGVA